MLPQKVVSLLENLLRRQLFSFLIPYPSYFAVCRTNSYLSDLVLSLTFRPNSLHLYDQNFLIFSAMDLFGSLKLVDLYQENVFKCITYDT